MIDTPAQFATKNAAQFEEANRVLDALCREYIVLLAEDLVKNTPGFGNQMPSDTKYIPTGRLRGGWGWTATPVRSSAKGLGVTKQTAAGKITTEFARRADDGPFSDYGVQTIQRIREQVMASPILPISYLENNVGYGVYIVLGRGRHKVPRNWPESTRQRAASIFNLAKVKVKEGR